MPAARREYLAERRKPPGPLAMAFNASANAVRIGVRGHWSHRAAPGPGGLRRSATTGQLVPFRYNRAAGAVPLQLGNWCRSATTGQLVPFRYNRAA